MTIWSEGVPIQVLGKQGIRGMAGPDGNPIGTVIQYMGKAAPKNYLVCDGATHLIADYPNLAAFIKEQFGTVDYFGGDGSTDFSVPTIDGSGNLINCIKAIKAEPYEDIYSLEETVVGRWIDGKPIYKRVITGTTSRSKGWESIGSVENIDTVIICYGIVNTNDSYFRFIPDDSSNVAISGEYLRIYTGPTSYCNRPVRAIVEYTKTTDAPTINLFSNVEDIKQEGDDY